MPTPNENVAAAVLLLAAAVFGAGIGMGLCSSLAESECETQAIEQGYMRYDTITGELKWVPRSPSNMNSEPSA